MADEQFRHSYRIVPPVALGYIFYGIVYCVAPGVHLKMKTQFLSFFVVLSAVVNILLNFLFVPEFGMMGAAWATAITYLLLAVSTFVFSNRVYPISYEYSRLAKIFISGLFFFYMGQLVQPDSVPIMMAWYLLIVFAFPFSLLFAGILEPDEKTVLTQVLSRMGLWQPHS
jgi:O-antigen/teichoic acid export membrane protein